ncbi:MAG TPA: IS200/IS605 family transposase [Candidatus Acidoferrales bacterium]|nr:IS200/IS605 family transposase [Candidatus Acidoferrales bacterium]
MPQGLRRIYGYGHLHFITFGCYRRAQLLGSEAARDRFVQILGEVRDRYSFALLGYVVMPDHVHLVIGEAPGATPSTVMQVLKQRSSRKIRGLRGAPAAELSQFWERRYYDFNIRTWKKLNEKLRYMHMNPVKRGLVDEPQMWPWSSYLSHAKGITGKVRMDLAPWVKEEGMRW